jgi:hypothetical protein
MYKPGHIYRGTNEPTQKRDGQPWESATKPKITGMYINTPHTSIIKLWIKSNWYNSICSIQTYVLTKTHKQDKNVPSRSLFQEQRAPLYASNNNSRDQAHERTPNLNAVNHSIDILEIEMAEAGSNKRQSLGETNGKIKRR